MEASLSPKLSTINTLCCTDENKNRIDIIKIEDNTNKFTIFYNNLGYTITEAELFRWLKSYVHTAPELIELDNVNALQKVMALLRSPGGGLHIIVPSTTYFSEQELLRAVDSKMVTVAGRVEQFVEKVVNHEATRSDLLFYDELFKYCRDFTPDQLRRVLKADLQIRGEYLGVHRMQLVHYYAMDNNVELLKVLQEFSANFNIKNNDSSTALCLAMKNLEDAKITGNSENIITARNCVNFLVEAMTNKK